MQLAIKVILAKASSVVFYVKCILCF